MNRTTIFFSIIFYAFAFSIIGIISIYLSSFIMFTLKNEYTKLIFNTPLATLIAIIFFGLWEFFLKKTDRTLLIANINYLIYSAFLSFVLTILIFIFVINKTISEHNIIWHILEYLFILIPINSIIVMIKFYKTRVK